MKLQRQPPRRWNCNRIGHPEPKLLLNTWKNRDRKLTLAVSRQLSQYWTQFSGNPPLRGSEICLHNHLTRKHKHRCSSEHNLKRKYWRPTIGRQLLAKLIGALNHFRRYSHLIAETASRSKVQMDWFRGQKKLSPLVNNWNAALATSNISREERKLNRSQTWLCKPKENCHLAKSCQNYSITTSPTATKMIRRLQPYETEPKQGKDLMKWHKLKVSMRANGPQTTVWREIRPLKTCLTKTNLPWQTDRSSLIKRFKFKSSMANGLIPHKARTDQWILMTFKGKFQRYHRYYQCHTTKTYLILRVVYCSTPLL